MDEEKALITPETGLTAQQVQEHLEAGLGAGLPADSGRSEKEIILRHSLTFFNLVFIVLAVLLVVGKSTVMNMGFLGVVVINTVIGIFQEIRAKRAVDKLSLVARRPVKAAFGALLLALAGVILALSGGQFWAAVQTRAGVEETYTTVAVVTGGKRQLVSSGDIVYEDIGPTYEANEFLKEAAQKGWSIIRGQATMGLAGGYSPKLTPLTTFYQMDVDSSDTRIDNDEDVPYNFAILEIEITEVGEERVYYPREYDTGAFFNWVVSGKVLEYGIATVFQDLAAIGTTPPAGTQIFICRSPASRMRRARRCRPDSGSWCLPTITATWISSSAASSRRT